jgi:hypothetical protein
MANTDDLVTSVLEIGAGRIAVEVLVEVEPDEGAVVVVVVPLVLVLGVVEGVVVEEGATEGRTALETSMPLRESQ